MKEKLMQILADYFELNDTYTYNLTRDKRAFAVGTVTIDDFEEFDMDVVADIADFLIKNGVTIDHPTEKGGEGVMAELLPCPFCGGNAKFISFVDACSHRPACLVRCNDCGALTKDFVAEDSTFSYKDEAKNAWNTRTPKERGGEK